VAEDAGLSRRRSLAELCGAASSGLDGARAALADMAMDLDMSKMIRHNVYDQ
jgi:hypothetical protein